MMTMMSVWRSRFCPGENVVPKPPSTIMRSGLFDTSAETVMNRLATARIPGPLAACLVSLWLACLTFPALVYAQSAPGASQPVILAGCEIDYPPFYLVTPDGQATGFATELLRAAMRAVGRDVTYRTGPWNEVKGWLETGTVQVLPLVGRTPEREALFDFTFPYLTLHGAIVVRKGNGGVQTLADLKGRSVAVMQSDNAEEFLRRNNPGCEIRVTRTFVDALRELEAGRHDAVVMQRLLAVRLIKELGLSGVEIVHTPITGFRQDFCFAVKEGDRDSLALLNEGLALVMADGTHRQLHARWMGNLDLPSHRRLIIGGDHRYPPWEFLDETGAPAGFNVELTRAIAQELGLDVEIRLGPWPEMVRLLESGEIDALQGMFYSLKRDAVFDFSNAHSVNGCVVACRRDAGPPPASVAELRGRRITVENGDLTHEWALENGLASEVITVESQEAALREVRAGHSDCALVGRMTARYVIEKQGWNDLICGQKPIISPEYCYTFRNGQTALRTQFNEGLSVLEQTGEYRRIQEKWFGVQERPHDSLSTLGRWLALASVPLLVIFLISAAWTWTLKRQVAAKTYELRESEASHRRLFETMAQGVVYQNPDGHIVSINPAAEHILGLTRDQLLGLTSMDPRWRTIREDGSELPGSEHPAMIALRTGKPVGPCVMGVARPDEPHHRWLRVNARPLFRPGEDRPYQVYATLEDITELRRAREEYQQLFRLMLNGVVVAEVVRDEVGKVIDFRFLAVNPAYERLVGLSAEKSIGRRVRELLPQLEDSWIEVYGRVVDTGEPVRFESEAKVLGKHFAVSAFRTAPNQFASIFFDVTERRRAEEEREHLHEQLLQAQKMESVGRLAGGIAHDFNNILGVILGRVELMMESMDEHHPQRHDLLEIEKAAQRSADLTRQLLAFARKQMAVPQVINLNSVIDGLLRMLARLLGENIRIDWKPASDLWPIEIDPVQIDQVLVNLSVNARDAIKDAGTIGITVENAVVTHDTSDRMLGVAPGEYVHLRFADSGCGMRQHVKDKLFEPFFTTKDVGKGTGLGLATVYGVMKQNGGYIDVQSEVGKGTIFHLYFPRHIESTNASEKDDVSQTTAADARVARHQQATILLCEDHADIRELTRLMLEKRGFTVLVASGPTEALELARAHRKNIRLVITDIVMPEMNGRELTRQLTGLIPELKCLYMSGYTADVILEHGVAEDGLTFIQKPFTSARLFEKIDALLDATSAVSGESP